MYASTVLIRSLHISLHWLWNSLLIKFGSKTIKQNTTKIFFNEFLWYLCFIAVDFIHSCHHCLKMSSCGLEKIRFRSIDLTCWQSPYPLLLWFLTALNTSSWKDLVQGWQQSLWKFYIFSNILDLKSWLPNRWKIHSPTARHVYLLR